MPVTQSGPTPNIVVQRLVSNKTGQTAKANAAVTTLAVFAQLHFKSRSTGTAPDPTSEPDGDCYIVPSGATGYTDSVTGNPCATDDVAVVLNGAFVKQTPQKGWRGIVEDEGDNGLPLWYDGSNWIEERGLTGSVATGLTASTTQTQGQGALTKVLNKVTTCANANDVRTLPPARAQLTCIIANNGAQTLQVFPASGDSIDGGSVNASVTIPAGKRRIFFANDATDWTSVLGA